MDTPVSWSYYICSSNAQAKLGSASLQIRPLYGESCLNSFTQDWPLAKGLLNDKSIRYRYQSDNTFRNGGKDWLPLFFSKYDQWNTLWFAVIICKQLDHMIQISLENILEMGPICATYYLYSQKIGPFWWVLPNDKYIRFTVITQRLSDAVSSDNT